MNEKCDIFCNCGDCHKDSNSYDSRCKLSDTWSHSNFCIKVNMSSVDSTNDNDDDNAKPRTAQRGPRPMRGSYVASTRRRLRYFDKSPDVRDTTLMYYGSSCKWNGQFFVTAETVAGIHMMHTCTKSVEVNQYIDQILPLQYQRPSKWIQRVRLWHMTQLMFA